MSAVCRGPASRHKQRRQAPELCDLGHDFAIHFKRFRGGLGI